MKNIESSFVTDPHSYATAEKAVPMTRVIAGLWLWLCWALRSKTKGSQIRHRMLMKNAHEECSWRMLMNAQNAPIHGMKSQSSPSPRCEEESMIMDLPPQNTLLRRVTSEELMGAKNKSVLCVSRLVLRPFQNSQEPCHILSPFWHSYLVCVCVIHSRVDVVIWFVC